ncbi:hypothetical protein F0267_01220 [Vibrio coralliilyticus]|uniref:Uncharacterized protein n=1 Tax=Vibrio coralliilyticus TaxID=190893 RepID=A0AAN0SJN8_9VIBR|nr:hypothetical protein [Vibrio coralliilyticus]AIW22288.1 hypothetical protein IX92_24780 [Vibrio coralliilyticus]NOH36843.1 hypothetical protein [Vibrio coralliilyticus]
MHQQLINIQQGYEVGAMQGSVDDTCTVILLTELATSRKWVLKHIFSDSEYPESNDETTVFFNTQHAVDYTLDQIRRKGCVDLRHWYTEQFWLEKIYYNL